jgi:hypothetical protein
MTELRPAIEVALRECPPGPFRFGETLCFKTEYNMMETIGHVEVPGNEVMWIAGRNPDAYVLESGEVFWGGAKTHEARAELLVCPVELADRRALVDAIVAMLWADVDKSMHVQDISDMIAQRFGGTI